MDAEDLEYAARGLSRRTLLMGAAGATAFLAFPPIVSSAQAAVAWNHPFTTRGAIFPDGGGYEAPRGTGLHQGIDFNNNKHPAGTSIYSCAAGTVSGRATSDSVYGNVVKINHGYGYETLYGHMQSGSIPSDLIVGAPLPAASLVGRVGGTQGSAAPLPAHLHLGLYLNGVRQDPGFLVLADLAIPGSSGSPVSTGSISGDPMTDIIYYAYENTATGASATTQGLKSPVTTVPYGSIWYQECVGAPLFKIADTYETPEWRAFAAVRAGNVEGGRYMTTAAKIAALIDLRGEASAPIAAMAPLRTI